MLASESKGKKNPIVLMLLSSYANWIFSRITANAPYLLPKTNKLDEQMNTVQKMIGLNWNLQHGSRNMLVVEERYRNIP